jgi:hypothetical protein
MHTVSRKVRASITTAVIAFLGVLMVLTTASPASATYNNGARHNLGVTSNSQAPVLVQFQNSSYQNTNVYVPVGQTYGEGTYNQVFSEPQQFRTNPGWCSEWQTVEHYPSGAVFTSNWHLALGGDAGGNWTYIHPGYVSMDEYHVRVRHWDC